MVHGLGYAPLSVRIVQAMSLRQGSSVSHVPSWATTQVSDHLILYETLSDLMCVVAIKND